MCVRLSLKKFVIINIVVTAGILTLLYRKAKNNDEENTTISQRGHLQTQQTVREGGLYDTHQENIKRRSRISHTCGKYGITRIIDKSNPNSHYWNLIYNDQYKFIYSLMPKVASHTWRLIIGEHFSRSKVLSHCRTMEESAYRLQRYVVFIFVREPLERLLSAYLGKFTPHTNVQRLYEKAYGKKIVKKFRDEKNSYDKIYGRKSRDGISDGGQGWLNVTFSEFVQLVIDAGNGSSINGMTHHWMPQYRVGLVCDVSYTVIGHYETLSPDAKYVLSKLRLDEVVNFPAVHQSRAAANFDEYYGTLTPDVMSRLVDFYRLDYEMFGYSVPSSIRRFMMIKPR